MRRTRFLLAHANLGKIAFKEEVEECADHSNRGHPNYGFPARCDRRIDYVCRQLKS
jgi:hypothetical protein